MKQIYAFENIGDYTKYKEVTDRLFAKLEKYSLILEEQFALNEKPKGIVWTTEELATTTFSNIPIPAFTNKDLIYMSPNLGQWRQLFLQQLEGRDLPSIRKFYESFSENQLFIILAHELTHHSDLFPDEFDESREESIWFEEGMCFYLPRKIMLSKDEFEEVSKIEFMLIEEFKDIYGKSSLEQFGINSYAGSLTSIMYDYWRSYAEVKNLVEKNANGDIMRVFEEYHNWHKSEKKIPLTQFFDINFELLT